MKELRNKCWLFIYYLFVTDPRFPVEWSNGYCLLEERWWSAWRTWADRSCIEQFESCLDCKGSCYLSLWDGSAFDVSCIYTFILLANKLLYVLGSINYYCYGLVLMFWTFSYYSLFHFLSVHYSLYLNLTIRTCILYLH